MSTLQPMLAARLEAEHLATLRYPLLATPKLDGIRCVKLGGQALSRSFKPIRSVAVREALEALPDGLDGELVVPGTFQDVASGIMSFGKRPDVAYKVFDFVSADRSMPYIDRVGVLRSLALPSWVEVLEPTRVDGERALLAVEDGFLSAGFEGVVLRDPAGAYKWGRSTLREGGMLKLKRFEDSEAVVTGFLEGQTNQNDQEPDAFGRMKRPGGQAMVFTTGTLGSILARDEAVWPGVELRIGSGPGLTRALRQRIWDDRSSYLGLTVKYRFQRDGSKDKPRFPQFLGFRSRDDM